MDMGDHSKSVDDLMCMGKQVFRPYTRPDRAEKVKTTCGGYEIVALALTDKDCNEFVHTNTDSTECPNYGFLIMHKDVPDFKMFYATDCQYIKWKLPTLSYALLGVDYATSMLDVENANKFQHQIQGHLSIDTACEFIKANEITDKIILTHLSVTNADADSFKAKAESVATCSVCTTEPNFEITIKE